VQPILPQKDIIKSLKAKIAGLKRSQRFIGLRESSAFADELAGLLGDIQSATQDPKAGLELMSSFYECIDPIFERCDDSDGIIGDVFRFDAGDAFVQYAVLCEDKKWLAEKLTHLYSQDEYGVKDALLEAASAYLPAGDLRQLCDHFWKCSEKEKEGSHAVRHWLSGLELLARQLGDAALFEKARLSAWPGLSTVACIDIASVYLETGDAVSALSWIDRIPEADGFRKDDKEQLLLEIYKKLGYREKMKEVAWCLFRDYRSKKTLEQLLEAIGEQEGEKVIEEEARLILASKNFSCTNAEFLIEMGKMEDAESCILIHSSELNGDFYTSLLSLAKAMEKDTRWLAATVIYRALLESILRKAQSKYYHHGVRYLRKLDGLDGKVVEWRNVAPHRDYKEVLLKTHGRKTSFWSRYNNPSPHTRY